MTFRVIIEDHLCKVLGFDEIEVWKAAKATNVDVEEDGE